MTEAEVAASETVYTNISKIGMPVVICVYIETTSTSYPECNNVDENGNHLPHSNGFICQPKVSVVTTLIGCTAGGGGESSTGGSTSGTDSGSNPIGSGGSGGGFSTSPTGGFTQAQYQFLSQLSDISASENFFTFDEITQTSILNYVEANSSNNLLINAIAYFLNHTNTLWISNQSAQTQQSIFNYLIANGFSTQSRDFVNELIIYCISNTDTFEVINETNNILSILTNGQIIGQAVNYGNSTPITDMTNYLSCLNTSQAATLSISVDQPDAGDHDLFTANGGVGHTFITIKQGNKVKSFGFYPIVSAQSVIPNFITPDPNDFYNTPGEFHNNENTDFDVSLSVPISATQLTNLINGTIAVANSNPVYNLGTLNCTDIAIMIFEANTNVDIPSCESPNILWDGQTPGTLGEVIRSLTTPSGGTKNINGGTSPLNNCN